MAFKGFDIEEDDSKFRLFMQSEQFKAACKGVRKYEEQAEGLTPAEVWHEVDLILADLKTLEAEDRDTYMEQVLVRERRRHHSFTPRGRISAPSKAIEPV